MRFFVPILLGVSVFGHAETAPVPWDQLRQRAARSLAAPVQPAAGDSVLRGMEWKLESSGLAAEARALRDFRRAHGPRAKGVLVTDPSARRSGLRIVNESAAAPIPSIAVAAGKSAPGPVAQDAGPTPGDRAESALVRLTPEIRDLAARLDNSPAKIFAWVYNNVELEWYAWAVQNSQCVYLSGRANDFDTSTFLIALLRAAGIPARYVGTFIRLPHAEVQQVTGTKDQAAALQILQNSTYVETAADHVRMDWFSVEAYIGQRWTPLDAAFKRFEYQPGVVIPKPAFDRTAFLSTLQTRLPGDAYLEQVSQYLRASRPGTALSNLPYTGRIVPYRKQVCRGGCPMKSSGPTKRFPSSPTSFTTVWQ
jgi:transglutaminase-like putative cysteine protease